jgi:hypothetical protein
MTQMIEEDLFFPGKPIDVNDDLSTLSEDATSGDTNDALVTNGLPTMPPIDEQEAIKSYPDSSRFLSDISPSAF